MLPFKPRISPVILAARVLMTTNIQTLQARPYSSTWPRSNDVTPVDGYYFVRVEDDVYAPTNLAIGPWMENAQHGGPISALTARLLVDHAEASSSGSSFHLSKLSVHLHRPIPITPHRIAISSVFSSRNIFHVRANIQEPTSSSTTLTPKVFAQVDAVLTRHQPINTILHERQEMGRAFDVQVEEDKAKPGSRHIRKRTFKHIQDHIKPHPRFFGRDTFMQSLSSSFVVGPPGFFRDPRTSDPSTWMDPVEVWATPAKGLKLYKDQINETFRELTAQDFLITMGDAASGASACLEWGRFAFSNIDYNVFLEHEPAYWSFENEPGESRWLAFRAATRVKGTGTGKCHAVFFGALPSGKYPEYLANSIQTLIVKEVTPN